MSTEPYYTNEEYFTIQSLRDRGYAICIFSPDELRGANPQDVEGDMCVRGWDSIDWHATEAEEQE